ncbi:ATP-binding protein Cassette (ABC) superfamily [Trypanosoma grayi]|uniref:ATP-binding protein Cassette (ABC) superfamily n=1 Tax=Trypanosoma grayi TaxID=71804 RepID=UPI0004F4A99F|nr:ATP-binding protein Cassette (ABC) superfamily [Trypanosoma grayi]KEG13814.1 ATP-binding protein Cassette (ABC) superfamily [Trypanosoma grayi]
MRRLALRACTASTAWMRPASCRYHSDGPLVVGGNAAGVVRDGEAVKMTLSDFVGGFDDGRRCRASAGSVLSFLDRCGGCTAVSFIVGYKAGERTFLSAMSGLTVSTIAFNAFMFRRPVYTGDLLVVEGRVVHVGSSSLGVHLDVARQGYDCTTPLNVGECYLTMVCVSLERLGKPVKGILPALQLTSPVDKERNQTYCMLRDIQKASVVRSLNGGDELTELIEEDVNNNKAIKVPISDTTTHGNRTYTVGDLNNNSSIFGGRILCLMEEHARHCGRVFTGCPHVHTIGMHDMIFDRPLYPSDFTTLEAKVVYVRNTTMEVDVDMRVERDGEFVTSNRASFVLICMDEAGNKILIPKGLDLLKSSPNDTELYAKARRRYMYSLDAKKKKRL